MLLNYLKLSFRLLFRNPFLTLINVSGLSIGFATFLLLWPYSQFELKSDQFHKDADRIVRLNMEYTWTDDGQNWEGFTGAFSYLGVAHQIKQEFPEVEASTCIVPQEYFFEKIDGLSTHLQFSYKKPDQTMVMHRETQTVLAEGNFFDFFGLPFVEGDAGKALLDPYTVVLSESAAKKYFGDDKATGKVLQLNDSIALRVTGVFKNFPHNTHLAFDIAVSIASWPSRYEKGYWGWSGLYYMKLREGTSAAAFEKTLSARNDDMYAYFLQICQHCRLYSRVEPLKAVPFGNLRENPMTSKSKILIEALATVSFVVLIFAWINYMNLSANSISRRITELGTRKSVGAVGRDFFMQFTVESLLINFISFGIALTLIQLIRHHAETWFRFYIPSLHEIDVTTTLITLITVSVGVIGVALYPLLLMGRRKPYELFKRVKSSPSIGSLNKILITGQYVIATTLLVWVGAIFIQLKFILDKSIGIDTHGLIVIDAPLSLTSYDDPKVRTFKAKAKRLEGVTNLAVSYNIVGDAIFSSINLNLYGHDVWFGADSNGGVDESYLDTYGISLIAGRNFRADNPVDRNSILISKALAGRLGLEPLEALGKIIVLRDFAKQATVIGVINDYEFRPFFKASIERDRGVALTYKDNLGTGFRPFKFTVQADMNTLTSDLEALKEMYTDVFGETFTWNFVDETIRTHYSNEQIAKHQISFFTVLAIVIACLGLLGTVTNKVVEKTKEISIRKIMGAGLGDIGKLLIEATVKQIIVATCIGIPVAYFLSQQYIEKFSEKITLPWWYYFIPVSILTFIMFLTIASVVWNAARANPVDGLRHE